MKLTLWIFAILFSANFAFAGQDLPVSKNEETQTVLDGLYNGIWLYKHDCGEYPKSLWSLKTNVENCKNWGPEPYTSSASQFRDAWGNDLSYAVQKNQYTLKSFGADGKPGGTGINADLIKQPK